MAWALLVVNVLGLGVLGLLGGLAAQDVGRLAVPAIALSAGWVMTAAFRALVV